MDEELRDLILQVKDVVKLRLKLAKTALQGRPIAYKLRIQGSLLLGEGQHGGMVVNCHFTGPVTVDVPVVNPGGWAPDDDGSSLRNFFAEGEGLGG